MASTYVNNLRLNEMATGDASGTWGTTTNTNLELIGQALGYGTRAIANASTDNITIADGASDSDRAMYLKLTGGGQACTVTLLPNTASKVWMMENATSYTLTFTQGSGANVAILAGETKIIATDGGAGSGVVYDVLTDVNLAGTTKTAALTNAGALSNQGTVTVGVDDTGYDVKLFGATSGKYWLWDESADGVLQYGTLTVGVDDTGYDVKFFGATSGAYMLWDESADDLKLVGAAGFTVAGDIDIDGTANLDVVDIDGAVDMASSLQVDGIITTSDGMVITTADNTDTLSLISTDADASSGPNLNLYRNSGSPADNDEVGNIAFNGRNDNSQDVKYAEIEAYIRDASDGTEDGMVNFNTMVAGSGSSRMKLDTSETIFNDDSKDLDFRVESNGNTGAFFVNGGNDYVSIGTASNFTAGASVLHLHQSDATSNAYLHITQEDGGATASDGMSLGVLDGGVNATIRLRENGFLSFYTNNTERMRIEAGGKVGIGTDSPGNYQLSVVQASYDGVYFEQGIASGGHVLRLNRGAGDGESIQFMRGGTQVGNISVSSSATAYNTSSDYRLKENIKPLENGIERLNQLKPVKFDWKVDGTSSEGFIAHEVQESGWTEGVSGEKDSEIMQSMDYGRITPLLVKAIQEQQEQIEQLTTEIQTLKGE